MSRGGAEHAEKIVRNEHCNWLSAVTAAPRDQVFHSLTFSELPRSFRCRPFQSSVQFRFQRLRTTPSLTTGARWLTNHR
jgi:hypothetical protein